MAKLKMLALPKKPKVGKKPGKDASLQSKEAWIRRAHEKKVKYEAKLHAVTEENKKRKAINDASAKASTVISGIKDILEVRPSVFSAKILRPKIKRGGAVSDVKKSAKKKSAPKKAAKKKAASRKRR